MAYIGLKFGGEVMPCPSEVSFTNNKIWSDNSGRTSACLMVGDIRDIKKTTSIKWYDLKPAEVKKINDYISNVDRAFFDVTLLDECYDESTYTVYAGDPTYEVWGWDENRRLCKGVAVDLIER